MFSGHLPNNQVWKSESRTSPVPFRALPSMTYDLLLGPFLLKGSTTSQLHQAVTKTFNVTSGDIPDLDNDSV